MKRPEITDILSLSVQKHINPKNDTRKENLHPCQKPLEACKYFIKTYTNPGDLVLDSCAGSCTTALAALETRRQFICFEKDKGIFNIGRNRILDTYY